MVIDTLTNDQTGVAPAANAAPSPKLAVQLEPEAKTQQVEIVVNLDKLLIGDLRTLDRAGRRDLPTGELIDFLDKIVEGGVSHLPLYRLNEITDALGEAVTQSTNPKNSKPGSTPTSGQAESRFPTST